MSELMLTPVFSVSEQRVIRRAMRLLEKYQRNPGESFLSSDATKTWLQLHLARQEREMFVVLYLDNQNRLLEHETLFLGTINSTEVHPREIVKSALRHNAAAVILAHNHPSSVTVRCWQGESSPSASFSSSCFINTGKAWSICSRSGELNFPVIAARSAR